MTAVFSTHTDKNSLVSRRVTSRTKVNEGETLSALVVFATFGPKFVDLSSVDEGFKDRYKDFILGYYLSSSISFTVKHFLPEPVNAITRQRHSNEYYAQFS